MTSLSHAFHQLTSSTVIEQCGWVLLHSCWQFCLLAIVVRIAESLTGRLSSSTRYIGLLLAMACVVGLPAATWLSLPAPLPAESSRIIAQHVPLLPPQGALQQPVANSSQDVSLLQELTSLPSESETTVLPQPEYESQSWWSTCQEELAVFLQPWLPAVVRIWSLGVVLFSIRLLLSWYTVWRLRTVGVSQPDATSERLLQSLIDRLRLSRSVVLRQSTQVAAPIVVGCFRSMILLPMGLATGMTTTQVEAILAHELAHVRRYDYLVNLLQTMVETLFFYHPAVWWISHRIRIERENCCDDEVVAILGDRVEYGRALLAVEENRGRQTTLALGARGGSLLARVRRLVQPNGDLQTTSPGVFVSAAAVFTVVMTLTVGAVFAAISDDDDDGFGPESFGLRCRIVALSSDTNDDRPDLTIASDSYQTSDDVTLGIELKNVSDKPISLAGIRYGKGFVKDVVGTPRTELLAPNLFEFEFTDLNGKPIARPHREMFDRTDLLHSASIHELQPGESLVEAIRPGKLSHPSNYEIPAGQYKVRVRYHGLTDDEKSKIRKYSPDRPILTTWSHSVQSLETTLAIRESLPTPKPEDLVWGETKDGLQAAIEYRMSPDVAGTPREDPGVPVGTGIGVVFHLRNVSDQTIRFVSETGRQGDAALVTNEDGAKVEVRDVWMSGLPIDVAWKLEPGEIAQLRVLSPAINSIRHPGRFSLKYKVRFTSRWQKDDAGNVIFPPPGHYASDVMTGEIPFILTQRSDEVAVTGEIRGRLTDEDGKPVPNVMIACGALIREDGGRGGTRIRTDEDGNYRLVVPSPGLYNVWIREFPAGGFTAAADDGIVVEAGKVSTSELTLCQGRPVNGHLRWQDGSGVAAATVYCYSAARPQSGSVQSVQTTADGSFQFLLPPGKAHVYSVHRGPVTAEYPEGKVESAEVNLIVPPSGDPAEITLILGTTNTQFGNPDWVNRSTPGTQVVSQNNRDDVTGVVVDQQGHPVAGAKVFQETGAAVLTAADGTFRFPKERGTQFIMHVFQPGFHVWFGTPAAGDELKIVLDPKARPAGAAIIQGANEIGNGVKWTIERGVALAIQGIRSTADDTTAWLPDGSATIVGDDWPEILRVISDNSTHGINFECTGLTNDQGLVWPNAYDYRLVTPNFDSAPGKFSISGRFRSQDTVTIRVGITDAWGPWQSVDADGHLRESVARNAVERETYGKLTEFSIQSDLVVLRGIAGAPEYDYEIIAVDDHGQRHKRRGAGISSADDVQAPFFDRKAYKLDHWEFRIRAVRHWVDFNNISLRPGVHTDFDVKVQTRPLPPEPDTTVSGESSTDDKTGPDSLPHWRRRYPTTKVTHRDNTADITGQVLDPAGNPVRECTLAISDEGSASTDAEGRFRIPAKSGSQLVVQIWHPEFQRWYGAPVAGDDLTITLQPHSEQPLALGTRSVRVEVIDSQTAEPIPGVSIWALPSGKTKRADAAADVATDAEGVALLRGLDFVPHDLKMGADQSIPWIGQGSHCDVDERETVIALRRACQLTLRAVDARTGRGIPGVKFGRERAAAEYWMQVIVPDNLGANRPIRYEFKNDPKFPPESEYETDEDGYYTCLVDRWTWSYMIYQNAPGYSGIVPIDGRQEVEIPTPIGGKVEYTFQCVRKDAVPEPKEDAGQRLSKIRVIDDSNQPIANARVSTVISAGSPDQPVASLRHYNSSEDGWLEVPAELSASVRIADPRFFASSLQGPNENADPSSTPTLQCWRGDSFVGRILRADGRPAADAVLNIGARVIHTTWMNRMGNDHRIFMSWDHGQWPNWYTKVRTDEDGRFTVQVPPAGAVSYVRVGSATLSFGAIADDSVRAINPDDPLLNHVPFMVELKRESAANGIFDAGEITLEEGVSLSGNIVRADGTPAGGVQVWAEPIVDIRRDAYEFSPWAGRYVMTDAKGNFEFAPLQPGKVTLTVRDQPRDVRGQPTDTHFSRKLLSQEWTLWDNVPRQTCRIELLPDTETVLNTLKGSWQVYSRVQPQSGAEMPPDDTGLYHFDGQTFTKTYNGKQLAVGILEVDVTQKPPRLRMRYRRDGRLSGENEGPIEFRTNGEVWLAVPDTTFHPTAESQLTGQPRIVWKMRPVDVVDNRVWQLRRRDRLMSVNGEGWETLSDGSIQFSLPSPNWSAPQLWFPFAAATKLNAVRLELLPDTRFSDKRLGRIPDRELQVFEVKATVVRTDGSEEVVEFASCNSTSAADPSELQNCIDFLSNTGWAVPALKTDEDRHRLIFTFREPVVLNADDHLRLEVDSGGSNTLDTLARIRFAFEEDGHQ
ncbi:MAG: M48 family metalloprotease [Planctomycetaceae bacterium]|nr:M48 family metalloprotease [Planctomycetaceae bacterium]